MSHQPVWAKASEEKVKRKRKTGLEEELPSLKKVQTMEGGGIFTREVLSAGAKCRDISECFPQELAPETLERFLHSYSLAGAL